MFSFLPLTFGFGDSGPFLVQSKLLKKLGLQVSPVRFAEKDEVVVIDDHFRPGKKVWMLGRDGETFPVKVIGFATDSSHSNRTTDLYSIKGLPRERLTNFIITGEQPNGHLFFRPDLGNASGQRPTS